jgi:hypothetical protein
MTQDNLIKGEEKTVVLTEKELGKMLTLAKKIEREEIALMLSKDGLDKNSTTRATIARLVDLVRLRSNNDT